MHLREITAANEVFGKAKVAAGQKTDQPDMIIKGANQQTKGKAQEVVGAVKGMWPSPAVRTLSPEWTACLRHRWRNISG